MVLCASLPDAVYCDSYPCYCVAVRLHNATASPLRVELEYGDREQPNGAHPHPESAP